jgi:hypothetical protein
MRVSLSGVILPRLYRKRPVTIEALQFTDEGRVELLDWLIEHKVNVVIKSSGIIIRTLEGDMLAENGDYIIRGIQGEFYPCKPDIFEATYERV